MAPAKIEDWNGLKLLEGDTHFSKWVKESGRLDHDQYHLKAVYPYVKTGDTVLDIGANIGTHTIAYSRWVGGNGRVIAIEGAVDAFNCLNHNCNRPNVERICAVVSDKPDRLTISRDGVGENFGASYAVEGGRKKSITIDSLNLAACDYINLDVEGFEQAVLEGAKETIKKFRPILCVEINEATQRRIGSTGNDLIVYILSLGYSIEKRLGEAPQQDIVFIPVG